MFRYTFEVYLKFNIMKNTLLLISILFSNLLISQTPYYIPSNGLVGYWPFEGNANDVSNNLNSGMVHGATLTSDRFGNVNSAYLYNGINQWIDVANTNSLNPSNQITISVWVQTSVVQNNTGIVGKWNNFNGSIGNGQEQYAIQASSQGVYFDTKTSVQKNLAESNIMYNNGNWHNYVGVWDGTIMKLYRDSILVNSTSQLGLISSFNQKLEIGRYAGGQGNGLNQNYFNGKIDDIGIWNRALNQQEITAIYKSCSNPIATITPQSATTFCEGNSVTLNASTGVGYTYEWYNNNFQINNASGSSFTSFISGNYTVKVIDGTCNTFSAITNVIVNQNPVVSLASLSSFINNNSNSITLVGTPNGGIYIGSGVSGNSFNPQLSGLGNKTVTYNYTNSNNCSGSASSSTIVYDTTGVVCTSYDTTFITVTDTLIINAHFAGLNNTIGTTTIKIYPNPTSDIIYIHTGDFSSLSGSTIKITDVLGQTIFNSLINQQLFTINTTQFGARGTFIVQIIDANQVVKETRTIILN